MPTHIYVVYYVYMRSIDGLRLYPSIDSLMMYSGDGHRDSLVTTSTFGVKVYSIGYQLVVDGIFGYQTPDQAMPTWTPS